MYLRDFYDYKNRIMEELLTDERIVQLVAPGTPEGHSRDLVYSQVFPFEYIPETVDHGKTFICVDVDIQSVTSKTFMTPTIYVWEFTHKSKMVLCEGGVRTDALASAIDEVLNGNRTLGLGELNLFSVRRFAPATDYLGKVMTYTTKEFNRSSPTGKITPANRKRPDATN